MAADRFKQRLELAQNDLADALRDVYKYKQRLVTSIPKAEVRGPIPKAEVRGPIPKAEVRG